MANTARNFYEKPAPIMKFFAWVCAAVMLFNFVLICCDVFMRYAFNSPIKGTTEIVTMLMAWVAYAGMAYTMLRGKHMQLGAVYDKLQGRRKHLASFLIYTLAAIIFICFIKASWDVFWSSWIIKEKSVASVTVYIFIGKFGTFLGWVLMAVQSVLMAFYSVMGIVHPDREPIGIKSEIPTDAELGVFDKGGEQ
jgi:TRAP-type C4-dicarboxylate transport system permease small subunit